jgi:hypothetical protein
MAVTRLTTGRDARKQATLEAARDLLDGVAGAEAVAAFIERQLAAGRGWKFVMVDPVAYAGVVRQVLADSRRPQKAVLLLANLFQYLPPDGNEVLADRDELARATDCLPTHISEIMRELEAIGAVYRRKHGRGVRYFVNPRLGTHLAGAVRDRAQAEAPPLSLRLVEPAE